MTRRTWKAYIASSRPSLLIMRSCDPAFILWLGRFFESLFVWTLYFWCYAVTRTHKHAKPIVIFEVWMCLNYCYRIVYISVHGIPVVEPIPCLLFIAQRFSNFWFSEWQCVWSYVSQPQVLDIAIGHGGPGWSATAVLKLLHQLPWVSDAKVIVESWESQSCRSLVLCLIQSPWVVKKCSPLSMDDYPRICSQWMLCYCLVYSFLVWLAHAFVMSAQWSFLQRKSLTRFSDLMETVSVSTLSRTI